MRPHLKVGVMQKCVRSLMGLTPVQRFASGLAARICNPEASLTREFNVDYHGFDYRGVTRNRNDWCVYFLKNHAIPEGMFIESVRNFVRRTDNSFVCYDLGANVGHRTLLMAKVATRVIATEPVKGAIDRLREKIDDNGVSIVDVFQVEFDEQDDDVEVELLSPADFLITRKSDPLRIGAYGTMMIQAVNGDGFIAKHRLPAPHFIRISAGCNTVNVLKGLRATLRQAKPILLIECPPEALGQVIDVETLKAVLYDEVKVSTFKECVLDGTFSLEAFNPRARKLVCYPEALVRMAEQEACKLRGLGLEVAGGV